MEASGSHSNGNGELTREILRAELQAGLAKQTLAFKTELDERFKPVNEHISRIDRGEFTTAQAASILAVVYADKEARVSRRNLKAPLVALVISLLSLVFTALYTLVAVGYIA